MESTFAVSVDHSESKGRVHDDDFVDSAAEMMLEVLYEFLEELKADFECSDIFCVDQHDPVLNVA